ncbi:MAG: hypothetical protein ACR2J8_09085 [Thermomicrobiales bacterium]
MSHDATKNDTLPGRPDEPSDASVLQARSANPTCRRFEPAGQTPLTRSRRALLFIAASLTAGPGFARPGSARAAASSFPNLENRFEDRRLWLDCLSANEYLRPVKTGENGAQGIRFGALRGKDYAGIHAYLSLPAQPTASAFTLSLRFRYPGSRVSSPIQALEFTVSKWQGGQRWEWALQWQRVDDGLAGGGDAPNLRLWTGECWADTGLRQNLAPNAWHAVTLTGDIAAGQVHYTSLRCDDASVSLAPWCFPARPTEFPDFVSVAMQVNTREGSGWMDMDHVKLVAG